mmetsp:Transcript_12149/g.25726  ORF Transcript_12149/g.25726 Transcript_12149/m.25726 type:complete len:873 (+) Transcript_12149:109-2727(+)
MTNNNTTNSNSTATTSPMSLGFIGFLSSTILAVIIIGPHPVLSVSTPSLNEPFQTSFEHLPHAPCVSLFHRSGRMGCGTLSRSLMTGRIVHWSTVSGGSNGGNDNNAGKLPPYVALMDETEFTADNVQLLRYFAEVASMSSARCILGGSDGDDAADDGAGVLRGLIVINATAVPDGSGEDAASSSYSYASYSPEAASPQGEDTPSAGIAQSSYEWNPNGDGNTLVDYHGLPVAYVSSADVAADLYTVAIDQSGPMERILAGDDVTEEDLFPAIVSEFNYYMGAEDADSPSCLAWRDAEDDKWAPKCLPLAGNSVWAAAGSPEGAAAAADGNGRRAEDQQNNNNNNNGETPIVLMATSIDSTSMFHDASPGANSAATNILALLMAAKLVGSSISDATLDGLSKRIVFGFFQAESYGYVGSRSFLRDVAYPGFQCDDGRTVPAVAKDADDGSKMACLSPLRTDLAFQDLADHTISGMIAVDQVGVLGTDKTFYVHGENAAENDDGFLSNVLLQLAPNGWAIASSAAENDDNGEAAIPPTPLQSLVQLSDGAVGGAVLAGYDETFADASFYHSHLDSNATRSVNLESVAMAATVLARAAVASAYDNGEGDAETAAQYAANLVPELTSDDETFVSLADCLLVDGNCKLLLSYGSMERSNNFYATGVDLGLGVPLGSPPNYYPSVFNADNGQGFVQVGDNRYATYTGDEEYGKAKTDTFLVRPSLLEMGIHGMLNDFLGRGSASANADGDGEPDLKSCKSSKDCASVSYCSAAGDEAICSGSGVCVCARAHYHVALDEAIVPAPNNFTGKFLFSDDDQGVSPVYTEPYWSYDVGVRVYRDAGDSSGDWALVAGIIVSAFSIAATVLLKRRLKKEKLY